MLWDLIQYTESLYLKVNWSNLTWLTESRFIRYLFRCFFLWLGLCIIKDLYPNHHLLDNVIPNLNLFLTPVSAADTLSYYIDVQVLLKVRIHQTCLGGPSAQTRLAGIILAQLSTSQCRGYTNKMAWWYNSSQVGGLVEYCLNCFYTIFIEEAPFYKQYGRGGAILWTILERRGHFIDLSI